VIQEMKERLEKGEMDAHLDEDETPWYVPGQPVNGMEPEPEEPGREGEQEKPEEKDPEAGKWGRTRREGPPRL
jgi:hypothetical protein